MQQSISGELLPDPETVGRLLAEQCPELAGRAVCFLDEGWDFAVYEVDGGWLCRLPKRDDSERQLLVESAMLPQLAPLLGVPVPQFLWVGVAGPTFPRAFAIYRRIEGEVARGVQPSDEMIAAVAPTFASVLAALHGFPVERALEAGVLVEAFDLSEMQAEALGRLRSIEAQLRPGIVARCRAALAIGTLLDQPALSVPIHADFTNEHLLIDPVAGSLTGIIDWGDLQIGDPAADFAGLYGWGGERLVRAVHSLYNRGWEGDGVVDRARFLAVCKELHNLQYWLKVEHAEYAADALRALGCVLEAND